MTTTTYFLAGRQMPEMPDPEDELRACATEAMHAMLDNDWVDVAQSYMEQCVDPESLAVFGRPDTSDNVFGDMATALSQPGHYSRGWAADHPRRAAQKVIGPNGMLDRAGYRSRMTYVERGAWGLGDYGLYVEASSGDTLAFHPVRPDRIWFRGAPSDASKPVELWHYKRRYVAAAGRRLWCTDRYSIEDKNAPWFRVVVEESYQVPTYDSSGIIVHLSEVKAGADITTEVLGDWLAKIAEQRGGEVPKEVTGDLYIWRDASGAPLIPYAILRTVDSGRQWNYTARYGCFLSTCAIALLQTYVMHASRDASGSMVIMQDIRRPSVDHQNVHEAQSAGTVRITAGGMLFVQSDPESKSGGKVTQIGPGQNLQSLSMFLHQQRAQAAQRFGVGGGEAIRNDANPTSASALLITEQKKMAATRAADELFRMFDKEVLRIASACLRAWGVEVPEAGYSIQYYQPAPTPAEMKERREQEQYDVEKGYRSKVQVYMDNHPGIDRKGAIQRLAQMAEDERLLNAAINAGTEANNCIPVDVDDYMEAVEHAAEAADIIESARVRDGGLTSDEMMVIAEALTEVVDLLAGGGDGDDDPEEDADDEPGTVPPMDGE